MNHWASHEGDIRRATMNGHQPIHKRLARTLRYCVGKTGRVGCFFVVAHPDRILTVNVEGD